MIDENYKHQSLTKAWCGMCNYFMSISENGCCEKCPFKDSELCYDANEECDYDKFEELIKGIKINDENKKVPKMNDELFKQFLKELDEAPIMSRKTRCVISGIILRLAPNALKMIARRGSQDE